MTASALTATPPPAPAPGPGGWLRRTVITFTIATVVGFALATQAVLAMSGFGRPVSWTGALINLVRESWLWALLVPAVFAFTRRFPLHRDSWARSLAAHLLLGATAACLVHSLLNTAAIEWLTPEDLRPAAVFGPRRPPSPASKPSETAPPREHPPGHPASSSQPLSQRFWFAFATRLQSNLFSYALLVAIWHGLEHERRLRERERHSRELSRQLTEARLQALRMQLNPHFLFNTLNAIATLVHRDPNAADEMIACLSDFLRLTLSSQNQPESPLRTELEFARRYLDIEKVRFGERLSVQESIAPECLVHPIPTLVLQPLLENAIRHGIEKAETNGRIELVALPDPDRRHLLVRVGNTGPIHPQGPRTPTPAGPPTASSGGVGLANTRARLRELHGDEATLRLAPRAEGGFDAELRLPWVSPTPPPPN